MAETLTGQEIQGYIVGPLIGGGGMGSVYQAFPKTGGAAVALKIMNAEFADETDFQERFVREVRLMERLRHDHIVPILGYGTHGNRLYFMMKLISGPSLANLMTRRQFSPRDAWKILQPLYQALVYIHEQGVIHRDIKPSNVFLERQDEKNYHVYLGDFGLGKRPESDENLTSVGARIGTTEYMSPEAAVGERLDHRADIYSLAVLTYELLLGVLPSDPKYANLTKIAQAIQPVREPRAIQPNFPLELQIVLLRGLEKERDLRYQTVSEFASGYYEALTRLNDSDLRMYFQVR